MTILNKYADKIYKYIYIHDGETILIKDIIEWTGISRGTVFKYIKWLLRRNLIIKDGKNFKVNPEHI